MTAAPGAVSMTGVVIITAAAALAAPLIAQVDRSAADENAGALTLAGARVLQPDGTLADGVAVVVSAGRIERFARADEKDLPGLIELEPGSVLSPGLIDAVSRVGAVGELGELSSAVDPDASAGDAVAPLHRDLRVALEAGITAAAIFPEPRNIVSGAAVVVRTAPADGALDVLRRDGPLAFAFGDSVLRSDREPTSRSGALELLRGALDEARAGRGSSRLALFLEGRLDAVVFCGSTLDARSAIEFFSEAGRVPNVILGDGAAAPELEALGAALAGARSAAVVGPLGFYSGESELRAPGVLHRTGVRVVLAGGLPLSSRHSPRLTAALAVRHGLDPAAARRALTSAAAELLGVSERVGSIEPGKDADLVVFSGDPLRLDSRVLHVFVRGSRVHSQGEEP